jgi:hypothetical protein
MQDFAKASVRLTALGGLLSFDEAHAPMVMPLRHPSKIFALRFSSRLSSSLTSQVAALTLSGWLAQQLFRQSRYLPAAIDA